MADKTTLSARQRRGIQNLLLYPTVAMAAEKTGIARQTVYKWLANPDFQAALAQAQAQALDGVLRLLLTQAERSVYTLAKVRDNEELPAAVRANAAGKLLSLLPELRAPAPGGGLNLFVKAYVNVSPDDWPEKSPHG